MLRHKRNAASNKFNEFDFIKQHIATDIAERISYINRQFKMALDLGCHSGQLNRLLNIDTVINADSSYGMITRNPASLKLVIDEEFLPFAENTFDAVLSAGALHAVNDLPGTLAQINKILKPDGLFIGTLLGGKTISELRDSLHNAEISACGGVSPRIFPFVDIKQCGGLLQRAGFKMPVVDAEDIKASYSSIFHLMRDIKGMGEGNILNARLKTLTKKQLFISAADYYADKFSDTDGRLTATFEIITITGWKC